MAAAYSPHVICVSETWLKDSILNCGYTPPNHVVVRSKDSVERVVVFFFFSSGASFYALPNIPTGVKFMS